MIGGSGRCDKLKVMVIDLLRIVKWEYMFVRRIWDLKGIVVIVDVVVEKNFCELCLWFIFVSDIFERIWWIWGFVFSNIVIAVERMKGFIVACLVFGIVIMVRSYICVRKYMINKFSGEE